MRPKQLLLGAALALAVGAGHVRGASSPTADEIIDRWLEAQQAESELVFVRMQRWLTPDAEPQEHRFLGVYQRSPGGGLNYFLRMIRPADVEGVTLLVNDDGDGNAKRYLYLPAVGRSRELTGEASQQPFISSDFTYADLEREVPAENTYERLEDANIGRFLCYRVRATEKDGSGNSPYAYRDIYIDQKTDRLQQVDFVDAGGTVVKTLSAFDYDSPEVKGATKRPHRLVMKNNVSNTMTEFMIIEGRLDEKFSSDVFTTKRAETWKSWELDDFIFQFGMTITSQ